MFRTQLQHSRHTREVHSVLNLRIRKRHETFCGFIYIMSYVLCHVSADSESLWLCYKIIHTETRLPTGALQRQLNFTSPEDNRSSHTPGVLQSKPVEHSDRPRLLKVGYDISSQTQEQQQTAMWTGEEQSGSSVQFI